MQEDKLFKQIDVSHYMIDEETLNLVVPGDLITRQEGFMNGHGTYKNENGIYSSLMGTVETTAKLIIVNPLKSKYNPQIGDIVVGRVNEISNKRWKIDIKASSAAYLSLNSTYIPEQRKKNEEDEFNMRKIIQESDIIVAEVHSINNDKTFNLHTRNPKYGRLEPGLLIEVSHRQIKRQKHHMITIKGTGVILGNNGNIYLSNFKRNQAINLKEQIVQHEPYTPQEIKNMTILANLLKVLGHEGLQISQIFINDLLDFINQKQMSASSILSLQGQLKQQILNRVRERIPKRIEQISNSIKKK